MPLDQHDDLQPHRVINPYPGVHVLHTPDFLVDMTSSARRKLITPPLTDPSRVDEHVRKTMERLRTQRAFRRHLGGAQNVERDSDFVGDGYAELVEYCGTTWCYECAGGVRYISHFWLSYNYFSFMFSSCHLGFSTDIDVEQNRWLYH